ncbi:MAG TPA: HDIG domain-containing protein, partial [Thermodesulfovibrionia bacterium]|nr:HDIG domain-containing protein [Thermodesulfovibrionia bacterium]
AAESIGENALLARVGAYYHDIGKIKMPEYFIENQRGIANRHDKLTPTMSSLILIAHVKEGVELARRNKLPMIITDIIRQHHGASLIKFFFDKAKELAGDEDTVAEENFRYPGPKPQNRVAALVMLADNVEAATRVLDDPTPARISNLVDNLINKVYLDGQLDACDLTLRDLNKIKHQFVYILTGIHHKRIDYPGFKLVTNENLHKKPTEAFKDRLQKGRNAGPKNSIFSKQK